jgi:hypothetical protein
MENLDLEVQLEDLMICHEDASDKSTDTWKTGLELHEDAVQFSQASIASSTIGTKYSLL